MFRREKAIRVVVCDPGVLEALEQFTMPCEVREAFSTGGVLRALEWADLVICDPERLHFNKVPPEALRNALERWSGVWAPVKAFLASPLDYQGAIAARKGSVRALPPRIAVVTGFGGVGKTTLVLAAARAFAHRSGLPVAAVEMGLAVSSFKLLLDMKDAPDLYEVAVTQDAVERLHRWNGVSLVPSDRDLVLSLGESDVKRGLQDVVRRHILTLVDMAYPHERLGAVLGGEYGNVPLLVLVVALPHLDSVMRARWLMEELKRIAPLREIRLVLNRTGLSTRLRASGIERSADVPDVGGSAWEFPTRVGDALLKAIYPGWRK